MEIPDVVYIDLEVVVGQFNSNDRKNVVIMLIKVYHVQIRKKYLE